MKLAMLLIAMLSLAATVAGVHCEDKNPPNDPGFCQREVGKVLDKIADCEKYLIDHLCFRSCGYCDSD